jgi:hypothetical protein
VVTPDRGVPEFNPKYSVATRNCSVLACTRGSYTRFLRGIAWGATKPEIYLQIPLGSLWFPSVLKEIVRKFLDRFSAGDSPSFNQTGGNSDQEDLIVVIIVKGMGVCRDSLPGLEIKPLFIQAVAVRAGQMTGVLRGILTALRSACDNECALHMPN